MTVDTMSDIPDGYRKPPSSRKANSGAEVLHYVETALDYFVKWPNADTRRAVALWVVHAHGRNAAGTLCWQSSPRLWFQSCEPGSGKSWAMKIASFMCPSRAYFTEATDALIVAAVKEHKSLFLDECDILFGRGSRHAKTKAIVNDGYTPDGSTGMVRNGGMVEIPTFGALSLAGLEALETSTNGQMTALLTRTIRIRMKKPKGKYIAPRLTDQDRDILVDIREICAEWASRMLPAWRDYVPEMPDGIATRLAELWEPLLVVADSAGNDWPELAREAAVRLSTVGTSPDDAVELADDVERGIAERWQSSAASIAEAAPEAGETDQADDSGAEIDSAASAVDKLVSVLADSREPLGATLAANRAGVNPSTARVTLRRLVIAGIIRQTDDGRYTTLLHVTVH